MEWASTKEYQDLISGSIQALPEKYEKKKTFITPALNKNVVNILNIDMITKWFDEREYLAGTNLTIIDLATCIETLDPMVERERKKNSKMIYLLIDNEDKTILGHGVFTYQRLDPELEAALRRYNGKIVYMKEG